VLVHCAGTIALGTVEEASVREFDDQYVANLRAPYRLTQLLLPALRAGGGGDVVFVNSTAALGPRAGVAQYAATQAALRSLADSLRAEVNDQGIRVMTVFPGRTATGRQEMLHELEGKSYDPAALMQPEDVGAMIAAAVALPRSAEVTDLTMRPFRKPPG